MITPRGYEKLADILNEALEQAANGKGKERHANELPFHDQRMITIDEMCNGGFTIGQHIKKLGEAFDMVARGNVGAARREILGAIVYAAGAIVTLDKVHKNGN